MKHSDLSIIAVGQPYDPDISAFSEGTHYNFDVSGHWVHYLYQNPTQREIESIQSGEAQFGLYTKGPIIFLLHQFGGMLWNDSPYSVWLVSEESRKIPDESPGHALLKVVMVDTATGIVRALRALTFSAEFTTRLHDAIRQQTLKSWSKEEHERTVRHIYSQFSTMDLVHMADVFCKGGE